MSYLVKKPISEQQARAVEENQQVQAQLNELDKKIKAEVNQRQNDDQVLSRDITFVQGSLTEEVNARAAGDNSLAEKIEAEAAARLGGDSDLSVALANEVNQRAADDLTIYNKIKEVQTDLENADVDLVNRLTSAITNEYNERNAALDALKKEINDNLSENLNDFTKDKHGLVPVPPSDSAEQILTSSGWRPVTSTTIYINELPSQIGSLTFTNANQSPSWLNFDTNKLTISGQTSGKNAGTYTAQFTPKDLYVWGADNTQSMKMVSWKIDALKLPKPTAPATEFNYTGNPISLTVNNFDSTYINQSGAASATNSGDYSVTYSLKSKTNTTWADGTTADVKINWKIKAAALTAEQSTFSISGSYVYTGENQTVSIKNYDSAIHALSGQTTAKDVGTYTVSITPKDGRTWYDGTTGAKTLTWSIGSASVAKPTAGTSTFTYDGAAKSFELAGLTDMMSATGTFKATNAGDYSVQVSLINGATWSTGGNDILTFTWQINPLKLSQTLSNLTQDGSLTYTGAEQTVSIKNFDANYHTLGGQIKAKNAGDYEATVSLDKNHAWADGSVDSKKVAWKINQRLIDKPTAAATDFAFDNTKKTLEISGFDGNFMTKAGTDNATAAGNYSVTFALQDKVNCQWSDGTIEDCKIDWAIGMTKIATPYLTVSTFTYNGNDQKPTIAGFDSDTMTISGDEQATNAGEYQITFALQDATTTTWEDNTTADLTLTWKINRKYLTETQSNFAQAEPLTFNGQNQAVTITNFDERYHQLQGTRVGFGASTYYARVMPKANYCWSDGKTSYKLVQWKIDPLYLAKPTAKQTVFIYDKSRHYVEVENYLEPFMSRSEYFATEAGEYTATFKPRAASVRWSDGTSDEVKIPWYIVKQAFTKPTVQPISFTYSYANNTPRITGYDENYMTQAGTFSAHDAGDYQITFALQDKNLHTWSDGTTDDVVVNWKITPFKLNAAISSPFISDITYTGAEIDISANDGRFYNYISYLYLNNADEERNAFLDWYEITGGQVKATEVGEYTIYLTPTANYAWNDGSTDAKVLTWKIVPIVLEEVSIDETVTMTYNGTEQSPTLINYVADAMTLDSTTSATNAGTYHLIVTPNKGYIWADGSTDTKKLTWTINRQALSIELSTFTTTFKFPYDGKIHNLDVAETGYNSTYHNAVATLGAQVEIGTYTRFKIRPGANYTWSDGTCDYKYVYVIIYDPDEDSSLGVRAPIIDGESEFTYDGAAKSLSVDYNSNFSQVKTGSLSATDAGTYTLTYSLKDSSYKWKDGTTADKTLTWKINRKPLTEMQSTFSTSNKTYTGEPRNVTVKNFDANYHEKGGTYTATNVGTYTVKISVKANYCWSDGATADKSLTWKITKRLVETYTPLQTTFEYDGTEKSLSYGQFAHIDQVLKWANVTGDASATDAGTYTLTYSLKDKANTQWIMSDQSDQVITWQITPVYLEKPTLPQTEFTYTGNRIYPEIENYNASVMAKTGGEVYPGDYQAMIGIVSTFQNNYKWKDGTTDDVFINWRINPARLTAEQSTFSQSNTLKYTGEQLTPTFSGFNENYHEITLPDNRINAGTYQATIAPKKGYAWYDGTTTAKTIDFTIGKAGRLYDTLPESMIYNEHTERLGVFVNGVWTKTLEKIGTGAFTASTTDADIVTVAVKDSTFTFTAHKRGIAYINITQAADDNYFETNYTIKFTNQCTLQLLSWSQIQSYTKAGTLLDYCQIGDMKKINLSGTFGGLTFSSEITYGVTLIGYNHNAAVEGKNRAHFMVDREYYNGGPCAIAFVDENYGEQKSCLFNQNVAGDKFLPCLPSELQAIITTCRKVTFPDLIEYFKKIFVLSKYEIDGVDMGEFSKRQAQYEYFANGNSKFYYRHDSPNVTVNWWTRTCTHQDYYYFNSTTNAFESASRLYAFGYIPCFTIS